MPEPMQDMPMDEGRAAFHALAPEACLALAASQPEGLSAAEAASRLAAEGPNALPEAAGPGVLRRFLRQFANLLIYVLIGAAAVTALLGHWADTAVIAAVVVVNAIVGFVQEGRAERSMAAIRSMLAPRAAVLRGGARLAVPAADLVRGDIVLLEAGDRVPADLRLLAARGLAVEEAILTGESVPVQKDPGPVAPEAALGDRQGMAWSGTMVVRGTGRGVVVATGPATEIGRISGLIARVETLTTPLVAQMDRFAGWLTALILVLGAVLLAFGHFVGGIPFAEMLMVVIGVTVAAIPEGLPAVLTIALAIGVQRMAARHVIVRRLPAIETLGAVSVICTDKTGTLTRNEMMVAALALPGGRHRVEGEGYAPSGAILPGPEPGALAALARIAALCNDAELRDHAGQWRVEGDPMEGALLAFAGKAGAAVAGWRRLDEIPFDAAHRYMAVLVEEPGGARHVLAKGAPERILAMCALPEVEAARWHGEVHALAAEGQRVLALASAPAEDETLAGAAFEGRLALAGLVGLIDPPRPEAIAAVAECHRAGIAVKMITGDHAGTAAAIGRMIGLAAPERVLTGADIARMGDAELALAAREASVFARTSPEHKLRLVSALQAQGLTVAMTGDGVNDAPALKRADAGVAMGQKGSAAAKEAAELVLTDDNFASIAAAVREGRTVFDNLRKVIAWTLPTNAGEVGVVMVALFLGLALPISPVQILWVNLITAATLGLALAFEPGEAGTMLRPPRPRDAPLLTGGLVWHVVLVGALMVAACFGLVAHGTARGYPPELVQTMTMNLLVILEIAHLFFVRHLHGPALTLAGLRGTPAVWICLAVIVPAQLAVTYLPAAQAVMGTAAVPPGDGLLMVAIGAVFLGVLEIARQIRLTLLRSA